MALDLNDTTTATATEPLTEQMLMDAFDAMKRRDEAYRAAPKGPCGCPACTVHPKTKERLEREGGFAQCANCYRPFQVDAPRH